MILLTGIRRIGKTSVLQVTLNEWGGVSVVMDCRKLKENYGRKDLYSILSDALSKAEKLRDVLAKVRGISVVGNYVELKWGGERYVSLADLFDHLNERKVVVAIDEAQKLRGPLSSEVKDAIAHAYDYDRNITFLLTGSEVGLLRDFLGVDDEGSPLFGRHYVEIELSRFTREKSGEMLRKGFSEVGAKEEGVEELVEAFDGIPGWLIFAGLRYVQGKSIDEVKDLALRLALNEMKGLTKREKEVLKCIGKGRKGWKSVKECVEEMEKSTVSTSVLDRALRNLEKMSLMSDYSFLDPIYGEASKML
ncbi:AAA family ATPase [Sulfuracidifex metallicus]|uniref:AAA family ATPase n=1 Tax=Sulfuracidifex metallicus TaxID=47303 RepID=UPI000A8CF00D|nr:ATP-binding protein [Sulfuracidifex metallicus]